MSDVPPLARPDSTSGVDPRVIKQIERHIEKASTGKPRLSPKLTPWFLAGFSLCGAVTAVVVGDPSVPGWVVKLAAVGSLFFGGLLGSSAGLRMKDAGK
jgi:acetyl-CoA carboxylase beta subunit